ncbi:MAG TPA: DUF1338 domain-containing protein [Sunxiuqinia sp.]|nr:DUF1338 domain-containing protein [Sunxiuqinia sp.]
MQITSKEITTRLLDALWEQYIRRVTYAKTYADLVKSEGGQVVNDHIAFRTLHTDTGKQPKGIGAIWHILDALGFKPVGHYNFEIKKLHAIHFEHPDELFPKLFVSQLEVDQLPLWAQDSIHQTVKDTPYLLSDFAVEQLLKLNKDGQLPEDDAKLFVLELADYFRRPWDIPNQKIVEKLNDISQYGAWVLLHGNSVNHFTAFINYQNVKEWPDLEVTCHALAKAGVPMKSHIEGNKGSILQQSSTHAIKELVEVVKNDGMVHKIIWTYAYYELAERGYIEEDGERKLFSGFLGEQASHLFDMTQTGMH